MILLIGAWYNEVGYSFEFSYKVDLFIREQIIAKIFPKYRLNDIEEGWYLNLVIATDSKTKELEVRGPDKRKRQKMIDYGLWLPFDRIMKSQYPLETFIDYYFDALEIVFADYGVEKKDLLDLKVMSKKEILNNSEYIRVVAT